LAKKFGVEAFPKLVVVPGSDASKHVKHEGKIKKEELISFLGEHSLKEKKAPRPLRKCLLRNSRLRFWKTPSICG